MSMAPQEAVLSPDEAKERFDWARRRGQPQWLWPEVTVADWTQALDRIEEAVRAALAGMPARLDGDPAALSIACYTSGTGPLLGHWHETGQIEAGPEVAGMVALHLRHNRARMDEMTARAADATQALASHGIRPTMLKGMHTAHAYFPDPAARPLSDIDLLIQPDEVTAASEALAALGYQAEKPRPGPPPQLVWRLPGTPLLPRSLSYQHRDDPWSIDLQPSLDRSYGSGLVRFDKLAPNAGREPWSVCPDADVLPSALLLLHIAVHMSGGLVSMTLIRLVELALVIERDFRARPALWDEFTALAVEIDAAGLAFPALRMCEDLVPGSVPRHVLAFCEKRAPDAVRQVVESLTPARAHRVMRYSVRERFMWTRTWSDALRLVTREALIPAARSAPDAIRLSGMGFWRLMRGTLAP